MKDISNDLVYIMLKTNCSSVYALFLLSKENKQCSNSSTQTHKETLSVTA